MPSSTSFNHETVSLDGEHFSDCEFRDCRLTFAGGQAPVFRNCKIVDCEWKFEAPPSRPWPICGPCGTRAARRRSRR